MTTFFPLNPSTALPPSLSHSLPPHLSVPPNLSSEYTRLHTDKSNLRQVCGWVNEHTCTQFQTRFYLLNCSDGSRRFQFEGPLLMVSADRFQKPVVGQRFCAMKSLLSYKSQVKSSLPKNMAYIPLATNHLLLTLSMSNDVLSLYLSLFSLINSVFSCRSKNLSLYLSCFVFTP